MLDLVVFQHFLHIFVYKWSAIVTNELIWYVEASDYVLSDEICNCSACCSSERDGFYPFTQMSQPTEILNGYERNSCRRVWRASKKEETLPMFAHTWLLLAHNEEGYGRFCENMSYLPSPSQLDPYSPNQSPKQGYTLAIPHLGARSYWPHQLSLQWLHLDSCSYRILHM